MLKPNDTCLISANRNHYLRKNVTTNEKYILRKKGLKFHKKAFYMYFVIKFEPFWS